VIRFTDVMQGFSTGISTICLASLVAEHKVDGLKV
jgi:hypothetical protein